MSWRVLIVIAALLPSLSGCASNRPLLASDGPLFGNDGAVASLGSMMPRGAAPSGEDIVVDERGAPAVQEEVYVAEAWGEPNVHPIAHIADKEPQFVADSDGPYRLDSGDRLRIFVYGQPNLSRSYIIDHAGQVAIPLIGNVYARGLTTAGLAHVIRDRLGTDLVRDPQVTVDILENRPFFILGEVRNPGKYPYVSGITVENAVAIAGGYTERASKRSYRITRRIDGLVEHVDAPADYVVKPSDTVYVYERFF